MSWLAVSILTLLYVRAWMGALGWSRADYDRSLRGKASSYPERGLLPALKDSLRRAARVAGQPSWPVSLDDEARGAGGWFRTWARDVHLEPRFHDVNFFEAYGWGIRLCAQNSLRRQRAVLKKQKGTSAIFHVARRHARPPPSRLERAFLTYGAHVSRSCGMWPTMIMQR